MIWVIFRIETSSFSGIKIHPGRGIRFIRGDGRVFYFLNAKEKRYNAQNQKSAKFAWTVVYRKVHKKGIASAAGRRRVRRVVKVQRQVYGLDTAEVSKRRTESKARRKGRATEFVVFVWDWFVSEVKARKAARKDQQKVARHRGQVPKNKATKKFNAKTQSKNFS